MDIWHALLALVLLLCGIATGLARASFGPIRRLAEKWRLLIRVVSFVVALLALIGWSGDSIWPALAWYGAPLLALLLIELIRTFAPRPTSRARDRSAASPTDRHAAPADATDDDPPPSPRS